jgi:flagellar biosynthesis protein FlhF
MTARRFVGATARDCLRRAKEELGPDAVVISNKAVQNGVEIVAMSPESLDAISHNLRPALSAARVCRRRLHRDAVGGTQCHSAFRAARSAGGPRLVAL